MVETRLANATHIFRETGIIHVRWDHMGRSAYVIPDPISAMRRHAASDEDVYLSWSLPFLESSDWSLGINTCTATINDVAIP